MVSVVRDTVLCEQSEIASKQFIKKLHQFKSEKCNSALNWLTKKVKSLFTLKGCNLHTPCKIYNGTVISGDTYIIRNVEKCWQEYNSHDNKSEPTKHFSNQ